jgi:hypothetical protein
LYEKLVNTEVQIGDVLQDGKARNDGSCPCGNPRCDARATDASLQYEQQEREAQQNKSYARVELDSDPAPSEGCQRGDVRNPPGEYQ